jgi:hypothetical protein
VRQRVRATVKGSESGLIKQTGLVRTRTRRLTLGLEASGFLDCVAQQVTEGLPPTGLVRFPVSWDRDTATLCVPSTDSSIWSRTSCHSSGESCTPSAFSCANTARATAHCMMGENASFPHKWAKLTGDGRRRLRPDFKAACSGYSISTCEIAIRLAVVGCFGLCWISEGPHSTMNLFIFCSQDAADNYRSFFLIPRTFRAWQPGPSWRSVSTSVRNSPPRETA